MEAVYNRKEDCCGCTACQHICPVSAIDMERDREGFLYPKIDQSACIDCALCKKVCAFQNGYEKSFNVKNPSVYAIKHSEDIVRASSTSGGAFTAISDEILKYNGVVFGAAFDDDWMVIHRVATNKRERAAFKGSKYVQSDLKNTFKEIEEFLNCNNTVLFTGTPCQTAGLKVYLDTKKINTEKLILCDIVCHGIPSPLIWKEHINALEQKNRNSMTEYYFRPKLKGWHNHTEMAIFENGKKDFTSLMSQAFKRLFYLHYILRPSCHHCKYTNLARPSDITIADFWGIENINAAFDDNKGVSLVIINSTKGSILFDSIKSEVAYFESKTDDCLQPQLQHPSEPSARRGQFWEHYFDKGYHYVLKKYADVSIKGYVKSSSKKFLRKSGLLKYLRP